MRLLFRRRIKAQADAFDDTISPYNMLCGGFGAGKTGLLVFKAIQLSWLNRHIPGGLLVPSLSEFKRDFVPMMQEHVLDHTPGAKYQASSGTHGAHYLFPWSKAPLYIFTAERRIKGPNLGWGLINEFSLMQWDRVREFLSRRRRPNVPIPQIVFAGTPEDEYLWLDEFISKHTESGKLTVRYATSFDNPFNDSEYGKELLSNLDEAAAQIYVYGRPGRLGKDYFYYSYKPGLNDFAGEYDPELVIHAAVDFNVGRMSSSLWHVLGSGSRKQIIAFDEIVVRGSDSNTEGLGRAIKARYNVDKILITCDASGKARKTSGLSDVKVLEGLGFKVRYSTANPRIRRSQIQVNGLLARRRVLINPVKCPMLKRDLLRVEQKADFEQDKSKPELTHLGDGMRYLVHHEFQDFLDRGAGLRGEVRKLGGRIL